MGNVNGIEDPARSDVDPGFLENSGRRRAHTPSLDSMGNSPPESPGRSQSPLLFARQVYDTDVNADRIRKKSNDGPVDDLLIQVPIAPLQKISDVPPVFNKMWMNEPHSFSYLLPEKGIPTMITWNYGGKDVAVEGSWDNWTSRKILQRSGKDRSILLVLVSGTYYYKFIVDGEWRYIPDLPYVADEMGCFTNILDVHDYAPENIEGVAEFQPPTSPDSSYDQLFPDDEDFTKEPLAVPPQLHLTILGMQNSATDASARPQHVVLNHLFIEKGWASQSLVAVRVTHRFQSKYVTVVLYKPLRK